MTLDNYLDMERMIEHGIAYKAAAVIIKPLLAFGIALGWWPVSDFIILQVEDSILLTPMAKVIMEELKVILGVLISFVVFIKIVVGLTNLKKEKK